MQLPLPDECACSGCSRNVLWFLLPTDPLTLWKIDTFQNFPELVPGFPWVLEIMVNAWISILCFQRCENAFILVLNLTQHNTSWKILGKTTQVRAFYNEIYRLPTWMNKKKAVTERLCHADAKMFMDHQLLTRKTERLYYQNGWHIRWYKMEYACLPPSKLWRGYRIHPYLTIVCSPHSQWNCMGFFSTRVWAQGVQKCCVRTWGVQFGGLPTVHCFVIQCMHCHILLVQSCDCTN